MNDKRKPYTAPSAERILLAPVENLATETDDALAMNKWGDTAVPNASIVGSNETYWGEDGVIYNSNS